MTTTSSFATIPADERRMAKRLQDKAEPYQFGPTADEFRRLSPAQQRVAIAKDVLKWLREGKIIAEAGTYVQVVEPVTGRRVYDAPTVNGYNCKVCALGAVVACAVERDIINSKLDNIQRWPSGAREAMSPYFDQLQLQLIETAFECDEGFTEVSREWNADETKLVITNPEVALQAERALAFGVAVTEATPGTSRTYGIDKENREGAARRMRAIMQNIIDNGGTFIP